jgi:hypothetical protein
MKKIFVVVLCSFVGVACPVYVVAASSSGCPEAKALFVTKSIELRRLLMDKHPRQEEQADSNATQSVKIERLQKEVDLCREEKILLCKYRTMIERISDAWYSIKRYLQGSDDL